MKSFITFSLLVTFNCTVLFSAAVHADTESQAISCQQTFHDYLDIYRGKQLQQHVMQLYLSDGCMPYSGLELPESIPQTIPSNSSPDHIKLLQVQDAYEKVVTYRI